MPESQYGAVARHDTKADAAHTEERYGESFVSSRSSKFAILPSPNIAGGSVSVSVRGCPHRKDQRTPEFVIAQSRRRSELQLEKVALWVEPSECDQDGAPRIHT